MKKIIIILGVLLVIGAVVFMNGNNDSGNTNTDAVSVTGDPVEETLTFYKSWLAALQSTSTDPYAAGLATDAMLGTAVQLYLAEAQNTESAIDPVLCVAQTPDKVRAKSVFTNATEAKVQVLSRGEGEKSPEYAVVSVMAVDGAWQISEIECVSGESAPEREFSFEERGFLLKENVPAPYDSANWHIVFSQNGQLGYMAPLFFDGESVCVTDDSESVCDVANLSEATKVFVQAQMTEAGAQVKRLQLNVK